MYITDSCCNMCVRVTSCLCLGESEREADRERKVKDMKSWCSLCIYAYSVDR